MPSGIYKWRGSVARFARETRGLGCLGFLW